MALNITETTSSLADLIEKIYAFATTAGAGNADWTGDRDPVANAGEFAISRAAIQSNTNDVQVAMGWNTGTPGPTAIYQYDHASGAGNYNAGRAGPWDQDNDSGNGFAGTTNASIVLNRHIDTGNTVVRYWAFAGRTTQSYLHIVAESSIGTYIHFGWGELQKFNDWQGGAYCYGEREAGTGTSGQAVNVSSTKLLDGLVDDSILANAELYMATINCESLPSQTAGGKWAIIGGDPTDKGTDRQSNGGGSDTARMLMVGGYRGNEIARSLGSLTAGPQTGFVPGYPIPLMYRPGVNYGPMGIMPDVRGVNISQFTAADEIVIGSDTWVVFPSTIKGAVGAAGSTKHQGIMYKKNA